MHPARRVCDSRVEHNLAKVGVAGSNPFARSNKTAGKYAVFGRFRRKRCRLAVPEHAANRAQKPRRFGQCAGSLF
jgi:hypothetical protein